MTITEEKSEVQELTFYTIGSEFTTLIRNFIKEGAYYQAYEILKDGGMKPSMIQSFFKFKYAFDGDTREGDHCLGVVKTDGLEGKELEDMLLTGLRTTFSQLKDMVRCYETNNEDDEGYLVDESQYKLNNLRAIYAGVEDDEVKDTEEFKHLNAFAKVFSFDEIIEILALRILKDEKFDVNPDMKDVEVSDFTGVILRDGNLVRCGHQEHMYLYPVLWGLGLSDSGDWTDDTYTIHITCGQMSGDVANALSHPNLDRGIAITEAQLQTCFDLRNSMEGNYGDSESISNILLDYVGEMTDFGGKFNNLTFLAKFYNFNLPKFSKEVFENACVRTSPKYSMAGLLNSKFNVTDYAKAIKEIESDFEKFKAVVGSYTPYKSDEVKIGNELHIFYQEFLEGQNGVCHFYNSHVDSDEKFTYSVSENQGDIVQGKNSNLSLSFEQGTELQKIAKTLANDLDNPVQIEFVISDDKVYIVQLRLLKNNPSGSGVIYSEDDILYRGKSFSAGSVEADLKDILVVDSDCDSELLIGKKGLIVREDVEFSHVLALSKALEIPSIYAVGDVELGDKIHLYTSKYEGLILKNN